MELRHLRYFVGVAQELNFTRASKILRVAQPALSRQIRQLEDEGGVVLLDRKRQGGRLLVRGRVACEAPGRTEIARAAGDAGAGFLLCDLRAQLPRSVAFRFGGVSTRRISSENSTGGRARAHHPGFGGRELWGGVAARALARSPSSGRGVSSVASPPDR